MKKTLIFGAGVIGKRIYEQIKLSTDVVGFLDNNRLAWNTEFCGIPVLGNDSVLDSIEYDEIIIASFVGFTSILEQLLSAGVPDEKIGKNFVLSSAAYQARINFLHDFSRLNRENAKQYAVAEGGVLQGEFAREINSCFPDSTLYLFDTFQGFDKRDIAFEEENCSYVKSEDSYKITSITSEELVLSKLPIKEKAVIRKGYFPETASGLENETFFFVNLDFDLYKPTLAGLQFFVPRISTGGVLLLHDYFTSTRFGVAQAVSDYEKEQGVPLRKLPIGDSCSLAILL